MRIFGGKHQHHWEVIGAKFHPRPDDLLSVKGVASEVMPEILHGFTLLTQQCVDCGWVAASRIAGEPDLTNLTAVGVRSAGERGARTDLRDDREA